MNAALPAVRLAGLDRRFDVRVSTLRELSPTEIDMVAGADCEYSTLTTTTTITTTTTTTTTSSPACTTTTTTETTTTTTTTTTTSAMCPGEREQR
jgi:hypothetical protein